MSGWQTFQKGLQWQVTKGNHVHFWTDNCVARNTNIRSLVQGPLTNNDEGLTVANTLNIRGETTLSLSFELSSHITHLINSTYFTHHEHQSDHIIWGINTTRRFSVSSCYNMLQQAHSLENHHG